MRRNCLSLEKQHSIRCRCIELLVERILLCARGVVGDDGLRAFVGDSVAQPVAVVGGISHDDNDG